MKSGSADSSVFWDKETTAAGNSTSRAKTKTTKQPKKTFQISAKGSLVVRDCTDDGRCLTIENTGTKVLCRIAVMLLSVYLSTGLVCSILDLIAHLPW